MLCQNNIATYTSVITMRGLIFERHKQHSDCRSALSTQCMDSEVWDGQKMEALKGLIVDRLQARMENRSLNVK